MTQLKVVIHSLDGKLVKGTTQDFNQNRPIFHLTPTGAGDAIEVAMSDIKAVYFVKDFEGNAARKGVPGFGETPPQGKKIAVLFSDGELLCGTTLSYTPGRQGFFIFPADIGSNNLRVYAVSANVEDVKVGPMAENFAKKHLGKAA